MNLFKSLSLKFLFVLTSACQVLGQDTPQDSEAQEWKIVLPKLQIDTKTFGGRQFWGDVKFFRGYRIQQNVLTGHYRLLDAKDVRRMWGSLKDCEEKLSAIAKEKQLKPMSGKAVILLHGIGRSSKSMSTMAAALEAEGYTAVNMDYPSTRIKLHDSAEYLDQMIKSLDGIDEINFVCWSMGGLLVRAYLQNHAADRDPRIKRMVMMGTPNRGAEMANLLKTNAAYKLVFGPAGQQLVVDPDGTIAGLPVPDFEFAIIAGARGNDAGWNPFIPGDDDGTVSVESTKLPAARDFMTVNSLHSFISSNEESIAAVKRFFATGAFREDGMREPVELEPEVQQ